MEKDLSGDYGKLMEICGRLKQEVEGVDFDIEMVDVCVDMTPDGHFAKDSGPHVQVRILIYPSTSIRSTCRKL